MLTDINEDLRKIFLAGLGAAVITAEKGKQAIDELVKRGEITLEQGKVMNEELRRNVKEKVKEHVTVTVTQTAPADVQSVKSAVEKLSKEDLEQIKAKIAEIEMAAETAADGAGENDAE